MKKIVILAAAALLFAAPAFAAITGSPHDLSSGGSSAYKGTTTELCVYCHTPHGGTTGNGNAPLWNRGVINATNTYNSPTLDATINAIDSSDAPLCLSCHDGASLTVDVTNPPNSGGNAIGANNITGNAMLDTDLSNDHPVGFNFADVDTADAGIKTPTTAPVNFGTSGADMWCSSCHDVHDNTNGAFLVMNNAGSNLCLDCHSK